MRRDEAIQILSEHKQHLSHMGVKSIAIFGSTARDEARPDSDVDVLVEIDRTHRRFTLFDLIAIQNYLEDVLGVSVDVGEKETLRQDFREQALREAVHVG